jgi:hypothetical protein
MQKKAFYIYLSLAVAALAGCVAVVGDQVVGYESGKFVYHNGSLIANYASPMENVWEACKEALSDIKAHDIAGDRKIGEGTWDAVASDEKIRIVVEYVAKNETRVSVRVGTAGNNLASQLIHDKIKANVMKNK